MRGYDLAARLNRCELAWKSGNAQAVADAVAICKVHHAPPPDWLCIAVQALIDRDIKAARIRKRDMVNYERWGAVKELWERREEPGLPKTWDEIYECASQGLAGTPAACSPRMMKESYQEVERDMRDPRTARRYYLPRMKD